MKMTLRLTLDTTLLVLLFVNCAIALECSDGENCILHKENEPYIQEITSKPIERPHSMSMLQEDHSDVVFQPTILPLSPSSSSSSSTSNLTEESKGRSLNFSLENNLSNNHSTFDKYGDLSDVDMDEDDDGDISGNDQVNFAKILTSKHAESTNVTLGRCEKGGLTYEDGEKLESGCDSICTCKSGKMDCVERCSAPYFRKGKQLNDPLCKEKDVDEDKCCAILVCAADTETEPLELCVYKNQTYSRGEQIKEGCEEVCTCEAAGKVNCKPRCVSVNKTSDRCVEIPDPKDSCCKKVLCDVSLDDEKESDETKTKLLSASYLNKTTIQLQFDHPNMEKNAINNVELSKDKIKWIPYKLSKGDQLTNVDNDYKFAMVPDTEEVIEIANNNNKNANEGKFNGTACTYKGVVRKLHEEFHDDCASFCRCQETGVKCLKLECPTYFGVDILDPHCIQWDTHPSNFTPTPPNCCPEKLVCKNNGSCEYKGKVYQNWQQIPENITGCEKRCFCEMGNVECQSICPPVPALPPPNLGCAQHDAMLGHLEDDQCCLYWICTETHIHPGQNLTTITQTKDNNNEAYNTKTYNDNKTLNDPLSIESSTKVPSKILGPLLVYKNDAVNLTKNENHYYDLSSKIKHNKPINNGPDIKQSPPKINNKPTKNKPTKGNQLFVTTPPLLPTTTHSFDDQKSTQTDQKQSSGTKQKQTPGQKQFPPQKQSQSQKTSSPSQIPLLPATISQGVPSKVSRPIGNVINENDLPGLNGVRIHAKGDPHDILQIINEHPEIANYPSGSVVEIHNIPQKQQQQFLNPNSIIPPNGRQQQQQQHQQQQQQQHLIPYVINHQDISSSSNGGGIGLEQFLEEIHKNIQPQQNRQQQQIPYPINPNTNHYTDGQIFIQQQQQNNPILNTRNQNLTLQQGHVAQLFPGGFPNYPGYQHQDDINVQLLEAVDPHTIRLAFTIPPIIVGLHGRVEVRYTNTLSEDTNTWQQQIFAPPNDLISTPQLEFDLVGLQSDSEYKIKISISMRDFNHIPTSRIYTIRTPRDTSKTPNLPSTLPIEPELSVNDVNSSWVNVMWRKFTDKELQFIDGVQLRFKEIDGKIYAATPLIHRAVTSYLLENLKSNTKYEIGIFFIPFPGQHTELHSEHMIHFTTANEVDNYGFNVSLEITHVKSTSVEILWSGVPYPEDKYVNIYRAIYQSDSGKGDYNTFKVAKRDSPSKTTVLDLKPGTRYRLWLEVYLTNGKIKKSNVQDFITKPRSLPSLASSTKQVSDKLSLEYPEEHGDYYGSLVVVAILAAVAILCTIVLLLILVRRHSQNKAAITPPTRVSQSAYDNPTYKVEIQQETMNL